MVSRLKLKSRRAIRIYSKPGLFLKVYMQEKTHTQMLKATIFDKKIYIRFYFSVVLNWNATLHYFRTILIYKMVLPDYNLRL